MQKQAFVINFEGVNCMGKTTQAIRLTNWFISKGYRAVYKHYPMLRTSTGEILQHALYDEGDQKIDSNYRHLLFVANRYETNRELEELKRKNDFLVLDRYAYSSIAYSCALDDFTIPMKACLKMEELLLKPEIIFNFTPKHLDKLDFLYTRADAREKETQKKNITPERNILLKVLDNFDKVFAMDSDKFRMIRIEIDEKRTEDEVAQQLQNRFTLRGNGSFIPAFDLHLY